MRRKLIQDVGFNDTLEPTSYKIYPEEILPSGQYRRIRCPYYVRWKSMLERCYSDKFHEKQHTYKDCTVCEEWLYFSNFKRWMINQDWEGKHLDKDLLCKGNSVYSPSACVFVSRVVNNFTVDNHTSRGEYLLGVSWVKRTSKYVAAGIRDPITNITYSIGYFDTELEAHFAWKKRKHELSCALANSYYVTDTRIKTVLLYKYKNYKIVEEGLK